MDNMKRAVSLDDPIADLEQAAEDGLLEPSDFLRLFVSLVRNLPRHVAEQAFADLPYFLDDAQRQQVQRLAALANRLDDKAIAAEIDEQTFLAQKTPRFGKRNPELMEMAFWTLMVRRRWSATSARYQFDRPFQEMMAAFGEQQKQGIDPRQMSLPHYEYGGAVWSFDRFGMSRTRLPDGRLVYIAGEHEDYYDVDFCIYNDVIICGPDLHITIYGYPSEVFPPTDFHSATLVGDSDIYIIGSLGYSDSRRPGETPVYRLYCEDMRMEALSPRGDSPGWISRHTATYLPEQNAIQVDGGEVFTGPAGKQSLRPNTQRFWLDLDTLTWTRSTPGDSG